MVNTLAAVVIPGLPVKPMTLFVNKAPIADDEHGTLTWGAAQAGVAGGVADAVSDGIISADEADQSVIIAAVWVNPAARDAEKVYANNRTATREALRAGAEGTPHVAEVLVALPSTWNWSPSVSTVLTPEPLLMVRVDPVISQSSRQIVVGCRASTVRSGRTAGAPGRLSRPT